jgi:hypothetical protein
LAGVFLFALAVCIYLSQEGYLTRIHAYLNNLSGREVLSEEPEGELQSQSSSVLAEKRGARIEGAMTCNDMKTSSLIEGHPERVISYYQEIE